MFSVKPGYRLALNEDIMLRSVVGIDRFYAFNIENGDHFNVNETAYRALEIISAGITFEDLVRKYAEEFELGEAKASQDLSEVIEFALENNIIKEVSDEEVSSL